MGRGRKGLLEQSQKKPKKPEEMRKNRERYMWQLAETKKINSMLLTDDFLEGVKRMEPKEVVDILFKK